MLKIAIEYALEFAGALSYKRFYFSANYVYGAGFKRYSFESIDGTNLDKAYSRLDAALVYKFKPGKIKAEAEFTILNIMDTENIKYSNIGVNTIDEGSLVGVYSNAVSFAPAFFLKIKL